VVFDDLQAREQNTFRGPVEMVTFGSEQYQWHSEGAKSHADPEEAPVRTSVAAGPDTRFTLPRASITVLRGKVGSGAK
jgi:hypothetical protein